MEYPFPYHPRPHDGQEKADRKQARSGGLSPFRGPEAALTADPAKIAPSRATGKAGRRESGSSAFFVANRQGSHTNPDRNGRAMGSEGKVE
jgi:hypothetical protein